MKKIIAVIMVTLTTIFIFIGCSNNTSDEAAQGIETTEQILTETKSIDENNEPLPKIPDYSYYDVLSWFDSKFYERLVEEGNLLELTVSLASNRANSSLSMCIENMDLEQLQTILLDECGASFADNPNLYNNSTNGIVYIVEEHDFGVVVRYDFFSEDYTSIIADKDLFSEFQALLPQVSEISNRKLIINQDYDNGFDFEYEYSQNEFDNIWGKYQEQLSHYNEYNYMDEGDFWIGSAMLSDDMIIWSHADSNWDRFVVSIFDPEEPEKDTDDDSNAKSGSELFSEEYNLFYNVDFPENYIPFAAEYVQSEYNLYYLRIIAEDTAENVVNYMSELLGETADESIQQNIDKLVNTNFTAIHGTQFDIGLNADCEIVPTQEDEWEYDYKDGYVISLVIGVDDENMADYDKLLSDNINFDALSDIDMYMDVTNYDYCEMKILTQQNMTQIYLGYELDDAGQTWNEMVDGLPDNYSEEFNKFHLEYGELTTDIRGDGNTNSSVHIFQSLNRSDICLQEYEPKTNLKGLGFMDFIDMESNVSYKDYDNGKEIFIMKDEWGKPEWEDTSNCILYLMDVDNGLVIVGYYPFDDMYSIHLEYENGSAEYEYYPNDDRYINEFGQDDMSDVIRIAEQVFSNSGDSALSEAIAIFDQYIKEIFGMNAGELFELSYE